jgi:hypothetical protein
MKGLQDADPDNERTAAVPGANCATFRGLGIFSVQGLYAHLAATTPQSAFCLEWGEGEVYTHLEFRYHENGSKKNKRMMTVCSKHGLFLTRTWISHLYLHSSQIFNIHTMYKQFYRTPSKNNKKTLLTWRASFLLVVMNSHPPWSPVW